MGERLSCSELSAAAGEPLAGTATRAERWLLVEWPAAWGRDAVADTELPPAIRTALLEFPGRVLLVRRPGRRTSTRVVLAFTTEEGGEARARELGAAGEFATADVDGDEPVGGRLLLVCAHGRRDPCCARHGPALYESLRPYVPPELLWQSSHHGGHRFAPNLLVLPDGVQLGRVPPARAADAAAALASGRIPLAWYRGRTLYEPAVQAAEVALRQELRLDRIGDVRLLDVGDGTVRFSTTRGEATMAVAGSAGPSLPASCGAAPEPTQRYDAWLESLA